MAVQFYRYSYKTAETDGCTELYRESREEDRRCRDYVQDEKTGFYANAYKNNCVDSDGAYTRSIIEKFGMERVLNMYAATIRSYSGDGRITKAVKEWSDNFNCGLRENEDMRECMLTQINPGIVDILTKNAIAEFDRLNLFTAEHCDSEQTDYEDKVVIVNHKSLKEEYWSPENQLWLATGGFGCEANKIGRAVYSTCLTDNDKNRWNRSDILGVIKDEFLPDWAREKLKEMKIQENTQDVGEMQL